jgi:hypothetical protein
VRDVVVIRRRQRGVAIDQEFAVDPDQRQFRVEDARVDRFDRSARNRRVDFQRVRRVDGRIGRVRRERRRQRSERRLMRNVAQLVVGDVVVGIPDFATAPVNPARRADPDSQIGIRQNWRRVDDLNDRVTWRDVVRGLVAASALRRVERRARRAERPVFRRELNPRRVFEFDDFGDSNDREVEIPSPTSVSVTRSIGSNSENFQPSLKPYWLTTNCSRCCRSWAIVRATSGSLIIGSETFGAGRSLVDRMSSSFFASFVSPL